jgi:hypothetical protein
VTLPAVKVPEVDDVVAVGDVAEQVLNVGHRVAGWTRTVSSLRRLPDVVQPAQQVSLETDDVRVRAVFH